MGHFFCLPIPLFVVHHISGNIHHVIIIFGTRVKRWYIQVFFHFCKILIFRVIRGVKGKKVAQNEKSSRAMSQEQCSMWSWFLVRVCKIIVAGGVFVIFSKFCFFELLFGVNGLKWWKVLSDALILGAVHHHCHLCVKW